MGMWTRTGPVVVEVDGSAEGLRVVYYAALEAIHGDTELVLAAPYGSRGAIDPGSRGTVDPGSHSTVDPTTPGSHAKSPAELADAALRIAVAHVRYQFGHGLGVTAVSEEGSRQRVLSVVARHARLLVVGRTRTRGPHRLVAAQSNLHLAARTGCPVVVVPTTWKPTVLDRKVAVGIDGTALSWEATEFAFRTAAEREGDLTVVHAASAPRHTEDVEESWVRRADNTVGYALDGWKEAFPKVRVTRFLTARPVVEALVHEGAEAGLVVLGTHTGRLPIGDPVARRAVAAMTCPVAIVPHHVTAEEVARRDHRVGAEVVVPTY